MSYIFYDFETTGKGKKASPNAFNQSPNWEQVLQVGAIVADDKFNQTNKSLDKRARLRTSIIPQPGAFLITQKTIKDALIAEHSSYELISIINQHFQEWKKDSPNTAFVGHNSVEFDEPVLENNLFTNLFNPYITRPNRGDTLNLARGLYAINPSKINIHINEKGSQIFRLELLAELNGLPVEMAHDALSDVRTTISLAKFLSENDPDVWKEISLTMNTEKGIEYIKKNSGFCYVNYFFGKIKVQALSMVGESLYNGWFHAIDLQHDPKTLLESNNEEFKKLIKKKDRWVIVNKNPIIFSGKFAKNYEPYREIGTDLLNQRAKMVFKNKSLAEKFKYMQIDRQLEKEEQASQDNIFPEDKANAYLEFPKQDKDNINIFHSLKSWKEKYEVALKLKHPKASFIAKRLIFDESPETLTDDDFRLVHRELHDRLVINQHRPFTTIPESMNYVDTEFSRIENTGENKEKISMLKDFNKYLIFMEKYFSDKEAKPLKQGTELVKQIFG